MRSPVTATDLVIKELTEIAIQYLCERELRETVDAINANWIWVREPRPPGWRRPARGRGRPPQRRNRHLQIAGAVAMLVEDADLRPTRSHVERRLHTPSACSVVTAALEQLGEYLSDYLGDEYRGERLSERAVEDIWNQYRLSPLIFHQGATDYARHHRFRVNNR